MSEKSNTSSKNLSLKTADNNDNNDNTDNTPAPQAAAASASTAVMTEAAPATAEQMSPAQEDPDDFTGFKKRPLKQRSRSAVLVNSPVTEPSIQGVREPMSALSGSQQQAGPHDNRPALIGDSNAVTSAQAASPAAGHSPNTWASCVAAGSTPDFVEPTPGHLTSSDYPSLMRAQYEDEIRQFKTSQDRKVEEKMLAMDRKYEAQMSVKDRKHEEQMLAKDNQHEEHALAKDRKHEEQMRAKDRQHEAYTQGIQSTYNKQLQKMDVYFTRYFEEAEKDKGEMKEAVVEMRRELQETKAATSAQIGEVKETQAEDRKEADRTAREQTEMVLADLREKDDWIEDLEAQLKSIQDSTKNAHDHIKGIKDQVQRLYAYIMKTFDRTRHTFAVSKHELWETLDCMDLSRFDPDRYNNADTWYPQYSAVFKPEQPLKVCQLKWLADANVIGNANTVPPASSGNVNAGGSNIDTGGDNINAGGSNTNARGYNNGARGGTARVEPGTAAMENLNLADNIPERGGGSFRGSRRRGGGRGQRGRGQ